VPGTFLPETSAWVGFEAQQCRASLHVEEHLPDLGLARFEGALQGVDSRLASLEVLPERLESLESGTTELAKAESVAAIWERIQALELERKNLVGSDELGEFFAQLEELDRSAASVESLLALEGRLEAIEAQEPQVVRREDLTALVADMQELAALRSRVERLEHGRKDLVRPEALSTLDARLATLGRVLDLVADVNAGG